MKSVELEYYEGICPALLHAFALMLKIKPCKERLPCLRRFRLTTPKDRFACLWNGLTAEEQSNLRKRMMKVIYRHKYFSGVYFDLQSFLSQTEEAVGGLLFEDWVSSSFSMNDPWRLAVRYIRLPLSVNEVEYCVDILGTDSRLRLCRFAEHLLRFGCEGVWITRKDNKKTLKVQCFKDEPPLTYTRHG